MGTTTRIFGINYLTEHARVSSTVSFTRHVKLTRKINLNLHEKPLVQSKLDLT